MLEFNVAGYNIIEASKDEWYVQVIGQVAFTGSFREVVLYSVKRLGFKMKDIDEAVQEMLKTGDNAAHFGVRKSFIYSFKQDLFPVRKVS